MRSHIEIIANAIDWIVAQDAPPSLGEIAARYDYDPTYFQKMFKAHVGVSQKHFIHFMQYRRAREFLLQGYSTLDAAYDSGMSGQGRLHDLFLKIEGMTPGAVKGRGKNITITYGFAPTAMGELMVAKTDKGICWLGFQVDESRDRSTQRLFNYWPNATFIDGDLAHDIQAIEQIWQGENHQLKLDLYGTNMQLQVWQALLKIPFGAVTDYKSIAHYIDKPKAARAVGNAVGMNPVSLLIPCHRVIQSTGIVNNYGWGSPRKKIILGLEGYQVNTALTK